MTANFCNDTLSANNFLQNLLISSNGDNATNIGISVGVLKRFNVSTQAEIPITAAEGNGTSFLNTTYNENTMACENFLLEAHYTAYFNESATTGEYLITAITADVVYGSVYPSFSTTLVSIAQKTSLTWM